MPAIPKFTGEVFKMKSAEVRGLWQDSLSFSDHQTPENQDFARTRVTPDGRWKISRHMTRNVNLARTLTTNEYRRLGQHGIHFVSFAATPINKHELMIVTPAPKEPIAPISPRDYPTHLRDPLKGYYEEIAAVAASVEADDETTCVYVNPHAILQATPYGRLASEAEPFLHTIVPAFQKGTGPALAALEFLQK